MIKIEARADNEIEKTSIKSEYTGNGLDLMNEAMSVVSNMMEIFDQYGMGNLLRVALLDEMMNRKDGGK